MSSTPKMALTNSVRTQWISRLRTELLVNILPFWMRHAPDEIHGGFHGAVMNDLRVRDDVPRTAVLCARILWTYSSAHRTFRNPAFLAIARRAYRNLSGRFWDTAHGGVYWSIDARGQPISDRKHTYAQAFSIYALTEYYRATAAPESLRLAQELFHLTETYTSDDVNGGNVEGCDRTWNALVDMRLSPKEPNCRKSMNTLLHVMEAYGNLVRVWDSATPRRALRRLIESLLDHVIDARTGHLGLFFDDKWASLSSHVSFGHDIEASWLLVEAAAALGQLDLLAHCRRIAVRIAQAAYDDGLASDGSLLDQVDPPSGAPREWWVQAEAAVGFYNAYELSSQERFAEAALRIWDLIEERFVDRVHGDWFKQLGPDGAPSAECPKIGPWECPYHHSRCCMELLARLSR